MLFTNLSIHASLLTMCHTGLQLILTYHFPDKWAGHNLLSYISKQTSKKVTNLGATNTTSTTKSDFNYGRPLIKLIKQLD